MRFQTFKVGDKVGLGVLSADGELHGALEGDDLYPGTLLSLLQAGNDALVAAGSALLNGTLFAADTFTLLPPIPAPGKIICIGLNYSDHAAEGGFKPPQFPDVFGRYNTSLVAHNEPLVRPYISELFDYEGELVVIIGKEGRNISREDALDYVAGYSIFNDGSVRDFQLRTTQWTLGKTFDKTGSFGPSFVTKDEVPAGAAGLQLQTRLNGEVVQSANIDQLIFDVPELIRILTEGITLEPGDVIITGTPSGIGHARKPQLYMKPGDICEVEIDGLGILSNTIVDEVKPASK